MLDKLNELKENMLDYLNNCEKSIEWAKLVHSVIRYEKHLIDFETEQLEIEEYLK